MVNKYEDIIQPPEQFRDAYKPRTDRPLKIRNARRPPKPTRKPPPVPQVEERIWAKPKPTEREKFTLANEVDIEEYVKQLGDMEQ